MLKRIISTGIAIMIATTGLVGCFGPSTEKMSGIDTSSTTKSEKPVTLKYYTIGGSPTDKDLVLAEINKYLEEKINVNLELEFIDYGDYNAKTSIMINSGEYFDLMFTCSWAGDYLGNSRKGAFLDLTPYLDTVGADMKQAIDQRFWDGSAIDGKNYAVPGQKEIAVMPMWVFTKEYVDKYDIPYQDIQTIEDLEPWLKVIKENEPDVIPFYVTPGFSPPNFMDYVVEPLGIELGDTSLTVKNTFETEDMKRQLQTLRKYYKEEYINADSATAQSNDTLKRFVTKADGQPYAEGIWAKSLGYDVVASPIMESIVTSGSVTGSMVAVNSNSQNPEKAVEFLNLLNTDTYLRNLINYGIEGVHYDKVEGKENTIKLNQQTYKNYDVGYYTLGNLFITYVLDNEPETKWEEFQRFNDEANSSEILGFRFDTAKVVNEVAAINNVLQEFRQTLFSGSVDVEQYLEEFNNKLYEQGLQKVIDVAQVQVDEWKTNN